MQQTRECHKIERRYKKKDTKTLVPYKQDYTQYDDEQQQD